MMLTVRRHARRLAGLASDGAPPIKLDTFYIPGQPPASQTSCQGYRFRSRSSIAIADLKLRLSGQSFREVGIGTAAWFEQGAFYFRCVCIAVGTPITAAKRLRFGALEQQHGQRTSISDRSFFELQALDSGLCL